jgi:hypothetical protein
MSHTASTPRRSRDMVRQSWAERLARFESSGLSLAATSHGHNPY